MLAIILLMLTAPDVDSAPYLTPSLIGAQGTGYILRGDAGITDLISRFYPGVTDAMKTDTTQTFSAVAAFTINHSGVVFERPVLLQTSGIPQWDTTIVNTLHGWVFKPSTKALRQDTIEFRYVALKPGDDPVSIIKAPGRDAFNQAAWTSVDKILSDEPHPNNSVDTTTPLGITFTFTGDVGFNDLQSHLLPDLAGRMREKQVTFASARFIIAVGDNGLINDVSVVKSTGKTAWDGELERAMMQWRFKPSIRTQRDAEVVFVMTLEEENEEHD